MIEAIRTNRELTGLDETQEGALAVAECVLSRSSIPQGVQDGLINALGIEGVIELVVLCGFYQMIAGVIFAFDVPLPESETNPFGP